MDADNNTRRVTSKDMKNIGDKIWQWMVEERKEDRELFKGIMGILEDELKAEWK